MTLTKSDIDTRATKFIEDHKNDSKERQQSQIFWIDFFKIFGRIFHYEDAVFEQQLNASVAKHQRPSEAMDVFWPRILLVEQKSRDKTIKEADKQADKYYSLLYDRLQPRYVLSCNFKTFHLRDTKETDPKKDKDWTFEFLDLVDNLKLFYFMLENNIQSNEQHPLSVKASELMGCIYDELKNSGYGKNNSDMEILLIRLTYCLFADDTGIFENNMFYKWLNTKTNNDGSDLGPLVIQLFEVLNKPVKEREKNLPDGINDFPCINGGLFTDQIPIPSFTKRMRNLLLKASKFNWTYISPAIFGSLFQSVMDTQKRRESGSHYTSEQNIMKIIKPLFSFDLWSEYNDILESKSNVTKKLCDFQEKLSKLQFLDPACGSGNFLIMAYREIRKIEHEVLLKVRKNKTLGDVSDLSKVNVNQFHGIEKEKFSAKIAEVGLWMMDHLMNKELEVKYGKAYNRIPLKEQPNIRCADALEINWNDVLDSNNCSYVFGNPPFSGSRTMNDKQREQTTELGISGKLDYVTSWFVKASKYIKKNTPIAFVSTNSITHGEQVSLLWNILNKQKVDIFFAYPSFKWDSEAKGKAQVTVVILGLSKKSNKRTKRLFIIENNTQKEENPKYISPYLVGLDEESLIIEKYSKPINNLPEIKKGSQIYDEGNYIFDESKKEIFIKKEPNAVKFLKPYINTKYFLNNENYWILDLNNITSYELENLPEINKRVIAVKDCRLKSLSTATNKLAKTPTQYADIVIPTKPFLAIPIVSSEKRTYVPMDYRYPPTIPTNSLAIIEDASVSLFGLLTSKMHMVWLRNIGGKLETRFRYSVDLVYNTFPAPDEYSSLEPFAQKVLDFRVKYKEYTLAQLYNNSTKNGSDLEKMYEDRNKVHNKLDLAVDKLYRKNGFENDDDRLKFLRIKYSEMISKK